MFHAGITYSGIMVPLLIVSVMLTTSMFGYQGDVVAAQKITPIPGIAKMIQGFDVTNLDLLPINKQFIEESRKNVIVELTYDNGVKWHAPSGKIYDRPDQVWLPTSVPGGFSSAEVNLIKTTTDLKKSFSVNVGIGVKYSSIAFSAGTSYKKMQQAIDIDSKQIIELRAFQSATRIDLIPYYKLKLHKDAQLYIDQRLTGPYELNKQAFLDFIDEWGTHYFASGNFGGTIKKYIEINSEYSSTKTDEEIKLDAKASYSKLVAGIYVKTSFGKGSGEASEEFLKNTDTTVSYFGGNLSLANPNDLIGWQMSVDNDPWLFSGKLEPIYSLVRNESIRTNLKKATEEYMIRKTQEPLLEMLQAYEKFPNSLLSDLQNKVKNVNSIEDMNLLVDKIIHNTQIPPWFSTNTRLCFSHVATYGDIFSSYYCSGASETNQCAIPNQKLKEFYDHTGPRYKGCSMRWVVKSDDQPDWFSKTQICLKYETSGGENCNGDGEGVNCSPVNEFTPDYKDRTSKHRSGACKLSWRLTIPQNSPLWLKTMRLCFYWRAEKYDYNCGSLKEKMYCVLPGNWTPFYLDNSYEGSGHGCYLTWGWFTAKYRGDKATENVYRSTASPTLVAKNANADSYQITDFMIRSRDVY